MVRPVGLALVAVAAAACAGDPSLEQRAAASCAPSGRADGLVACQLEVLDGLRDQRRTRRYLLDAPAVAGPVPLVVALHGLVGDHASAADYMRLHEVATAEGFAVVYPAGEGTPVHWNAGDCCKVPLNPVLDDVGFVMDVVADVEAQLEIDPQRIYLAGFSNGGMLAQRLACEHAERFAAVAAVSSGLAFPECAPSQPVPMLLVNGDADWVVPIGGSALTGVASLADSAAFWRAADGCNTTQATAWSRGEVSCAIDPWCVDGATVEACTVAGGGHAWPGADEDYSLGRSTGDFGSADVWSFLSGHARP